MKRSRMQQMSMEVAVGAFVFMILLALGFFTIILSQENWFKPNYRIKVLFDQVAGLTEGDKVFVQGVDVGRVRSFAIQPDGVLAELSLEYDVKLREDYKIEVMPSSVLGGKFVSVSEGSREKPLLSDDAKVVGRGPVDFIAELTETVQSMRSSLEQGGVLENLEGTMANLRDITDKLQKGEGTVGRLLVEDEVYNDIRQITTNLAAVSQGLAAGEGTLGKLLSKDDTMYNELNELVGEIRAAVDDVRETTPVVSFSSVFFGAF